MIKEYFSSLLTLVNDMSPYLLFGFFIAGLLQAFVPKRLYAKHLSHGDMKSVLKAALFGIPLPLCSCSVIPAAISLRKEGASKGASVSFLLATPQTGVDSILATYSLLGLPFAIIRPVAALVTALFGGWLVNKKESEPIADISAARAEDEADNRNFWQRLLSAINYGFIQMIGDVGKWLTIGLLLAALITVFVPDSFFGYFSATPWLNILIVLAIAVPMYICATGSIPIALSLMLKGLSPGAAFVLLMAGPAVNVASLLLVTKIFGRRTTSLYLLAIILGAVGFGLGIDYLMPASWFAVSMGPSPMACCATDFPFFQTLCTIVFVGLLVYAFIHGHKDNDEVDLSAFDGKTYKVNGMSCSHCKMNVESHVARLDGVTAVKVNLKEGTAYVSGSAKEEDVKNCIEKLGYECE